MHNSTKSKSTQIEDILDRIKPDIWFPIKDICPHKNAASTRRRMEGIKEFKRRERPGCTVKKFFEYYITRKDLHDLKRRVGDNGRINQTKKPKQVITANKLSTTDKLYNRFLGVSC